MMIKKLLQTIKTLSEPFFKRRSPPCQTITLSYRNIYIFFSKEGFLYGLLLLTTFVLGINYANNLVLGLCFFLASYLVVSIYYTFSHLSGLQLKLMNIQPAQVGDDVLLYLQVSSEKKQPHRQIEFILDIQSDDKDFAHHFTVAEIKAPQTITLLLPTQKRGKLRIPKLTLKTVYPLGILQAWAYVFLDGEAWVYPKPLAYDMQQRQFCTSTDESLFSVQHQHGQEEFEQLDNYLLGESLSRISWRHLARGQGLLSKRFADPIGEEFLLDYYQMPASHHEDKLQQLRFGIDCLTDSHQAFLLRLPDGDGEVGQGEFFRQMCLLRLAKTP